jgi:hypothetical protein
VVTLFANLPTLTGFLEEWPLTHCIVTVYTASDKELPT